MLLRPFAFGELSKPLQKMTILYAYSEKPIVEMTLNEKGQAPMDELDSGDNTGLFSGGDFLFRKRFGESEEYYQERMTIEYNRIVKENSTIEVYKGQIVQCMVENTLCRFYPDEYNPIKLNTFEYVMTSDDYTMEVENKTLFELPEIKEKIFYIRSRGVGESMATRMSSHNAKDSVIFRPGQGVLDMFCREHEIY